MAQSGYTITTVAGTGTSGFTGDGSAATSAELAGPIGLAVDSSGNIYIADENNSRIRKVSGGTINTIAGNGTKGYLGDGAAATSAELWTPNAVALDKSGNLYIVDSGNWVIRKVTTGGTISTVAGNEFTSSTVSPPGGYGGDNGPATSAQIALVFRCGSGFRGQHLHFGHRQQPHPQGGRRHWLYVYGGQRQRRRSSRL